MKQPVYAPGTVIADKYRIDKAIARGGCSIVYRGTHIDMQRPVALKIMTPDAAGDDVAWTQRFQREAKLASQLRHPNTITTYDHGNDHGLWYIIMEWVEGASLRNVIKDHGPIEPERCARLTIQMLKSLEEAHRSKILHRDMKPSNIMITTDMDGEEQVKVLDFGLAKSDPTQMGGDFLKLTRDGDFVGTPRYASPEQLKGRPLTNASDIYGVGMIMWEMLTGQPAVPQVDYAVCVEHHLGPRPWTLPPGQYPPGLSMIVEKALSKNPDERYESCQEMRQALRSWLDLSSGMVGQDFDLFDEIDSLGAGFESDSMGAALSDAVSLEDDLFEEEVLAPTKKNPSRTTLTQMSVDALNDVHLDDAAASSEVEDDDDSLLRAGMGQEEESTKSFTDMSRRDIELDAQVMGRKPAGSTIDQQQARMTSSSEPENNKARVFGAVVLAVILLVVGAAGWKIFIAADDSGVASVHNEAQASSMIAYLKGAGWTLEREPARVDIGALSQTTVRVKQGLMEADLILYETPETSSAQELEAQAKEPTRSYRVGQLVVWITPVGDKGESAVQKLHLVLQGYSQ